MYLVLTDESLQHQQATRWRRPLRGIADVAGALAGNTHIEGDISCEVTEDTLPHLLRAARGALVKTLTGPFLYTFTPNAVAVPAKTLSITVVRNGVAFGYVGCVISSQEYTIDDGVLMATFSIVGSDEADEALPTPTHVLTAPYGAGQYNLQIPTATQVFDTDTFTLSIDDSAEPQFRIKDSRGAQFVKFGERTVELSVERDFEARTDYDAYKALTAQGVLLKAIKTATVEEIDFLVPAAIKDSYEISGLTGQADLIRASISYQGVYNAATSKSYEIKMWTDEDITLP
jgi:hypothetical protein